MANSGLLLVQRSRWYLPISAISSVLRGSVLVFSREAEHLEVSLWVSKGANLQFVSYSGVSALVAAFNLLLNAV